MADPSDAAAALLRLVTLVYRFPLPVTKVSQVLRVSAIFCVHARAPGSAIASTMHSMVQYHYSVLQKHAL
jgi:hypothetical protein